MTRKASSDKRPFTTTLPASMLRAIDTEAKRLGTTKAALVMHIYFTWRCAHLDQDDDVHLVH